MKSEYRGSRRIMGFLQGIPSIRMEEEEGPEVPYWKDDYRTGSADQSISPATQADIRRLIDQREMILRSHSQQQLTSKELFRLLQENRECIDLLRGRSPSKFATELVIYAMLLFSATTILVLCWLTAYHHLDIEVTTTFVGTVVGGMIATIAQKLGKVGR